MPKINYIALNLEYEFIEQLKIICDDIKNILNVNGYDFIPMDKQNLHMTLVFLGSVLQVNRNNKIKIVENNILNFENQFNDKILEFDRFELFPTEKKNLIVAKFKCSDKKFISNMIFYKKTFTVLDAKEENYFTPHITLGKIPNIKPNNNIESLFTSFNFNISNININGCHLV